MGKAIPELLYVDFRRIDSGEKIGDKVLAGFYDIDGEHHGRPVYRKRPADHHKSQNVLGSDGKVCSDGKAPGGKDVILHYWAGDGRNITADEDVGWWFGSHIGASEVWAFHDKDSLEPPMKGWIFCDFFGISAEEIELVIEPRGKGREGRAPREDVAAPEQPAARSRPSPQGCREDPPNRSGRRSSSGERRERAGERHAARSRSGRWRGERQACPRRRSGDRRRACSDSDEEQLAGRGLRGWQRSADARRSVKEERRSRSRRSPKKIAKRRSSPDLRVRTASPSPDKRRASTRSACSARRGRGGENHAGLLCANPNCWFLVHTEPGFGGFCCKKCHWCFTSGSKTKNKHGQQCQKVEGPDENARRAEPQAPSNPVSLG